MGDAGGMNVVGIGGSTNAYSVTAVLLDHALRMLSDQGAQTMRFGAAEMAALPMYTGASDDPAVHKMVDAVRVADAVVIATPGYHGGMSGLVKNALDHLEALREDDRPYLDGRPVGLIVAASGWQACGTTLDSARSVVHALRGWPTPLGVTVNSLEQQPDLDGNFDGRVMGALRIMADQIGEFLAGRRVSAERDE